MKKLLYKMLALILCAITLFSVASCSPQGSSDSRSSTASSEKSIDSDTNSNSSLPNSSTSNLPDSNSSSPSSSSSSSNSTPSGSTDSSSSSSSSSSGEEQLPTKFVLPELDYETEEFGTINTITYGNVRIQLLSDTLIRIEDKGPKGFEDRPSYIVTNRDNWYTVPYTQEQTSTEYVVNTENYIIRLPKNGTADDAYVTSPTGKTLWKWDSATETNVYLPSPSEELKSWYFNDSPRIIPSTTGYSITGEELAGWDFDNDSTDVFVFLPGGDYSQFCKDYTHLTGESEMVNLQTLGYWDSRYYEYNSETALQQIQDYLDRGYSIDVLVIDTDWRDHTTGLNGVGYDINTDLFPDMAGFLETVHGMGVNVCFNDHPEPVPGTSNGLDDEEISYRKEKLTMILSLGIDYWWYDRNWPTCLNSADPSISVYAFGMYAYQFITQEYYEQQVKGQENEYAKRALIMGNVDGCLHGKWNYASDISAHRYSIQWTGDITCDSNALAQEIYTSVFGGAEVGLPYISSDIGGHTGAGVTDDMYVRWFQYGALSTILRVHCTAYQYIKQEGRMPWLFGETAEEVAHTYTDMRYRLLPLYYYLSYRNYSTGMPIMTRTDISYPEYQEASANDQYTLGDYILVAPIYTTPGYDKLVPDSQLTYNGQQGLFGEYFTNDSLSGTPAYTQIDSNVYFDWGSLSPSKLPADNFSIRWTGNITIGDKDASLAFFADDSVVVYIDGVKVIDGSAVYDTYLSTDVLKAGSTHSIVIEYKEFSVSVHIYMYYCQQTEVSVSTRSVFIPEGTWIDVWTGTRYVGPYTYELSYDLTTSPIFVREGAIIPLAQNMSNTNEKDWSEMCLDIYPSINYSARATIYEDDVTTVAYKDGQFRTTDVTMNYYNDRNSLIVGIYSARGTFTGTRAFTERTWSIRLHSNPDWGEITSITLNGEPIEFEEIAKNSTGKPFAYVGASLDGDVITFTFTANVYENTVIEITYASVSKSKSNANYDNTDVPFTLESEEAGTGVNLKNENFIDYVSFGEVSATLGLYKTGTLSTFSFPSSYDNKWINYDTSFYKELVYDGKDATSINSIASQRNFEFAIKTLGKPAYYTLYLGGKYSTARVSVRDRAGNVLTESFGNLYGSYVRKITIYVSDSTVSTLYVTYAMHASHPDGVGSAASGEVGGTGSGQGTISFVTAFAFIASENKTPTISVEGQSVTATKQSQTSASGNENLSSIGELYEESTLDWIHFGNINGVMPVQKENSDVIVDYSFTSIYAFGDYAMSLSYDDGDKITSHTGTTDGSCSNHDIPVTMLVDENVKHIRVYVGAWNATNTVKLYGNGTLLAKSDEIVAGGTSNCQIITFAVNVKAKTIVQVICEISNSATNGNVSLVAVAVTGKSNVTTATATVSIEDTQSVYLNNCSDTYETLYWEHYTSSDNLNNMINATDLIISNSVMSDGQDFYDYTDLSWTNGEQTTVYYKNPNGRASQNEIIVKIKVNPSVKQIKVFTGAWRATNTTALYEGDMLLTCASSFTAGESSQKKVATFDITAKINTVLTLKITPSDKGENGNVSCVAIVVLGNSTSQNTSLTMEKTEMTDYATNKINLTEKGTLDWAYFNSLDEMKDSDYIDASSLHVQDDMKFWDYKASFTWTNGTNSEVNPTDDDVPNISNGTNNGVNGCFVSIDITVDKSVKNLYLWCGGYHCEYYVEVINSQGTVIFSEKMHDNNSDSSSYCYQANFSVSATGTEKLKFVVYRTDGDNCSLSVLALA